MKPRIIDAENISKGYSGIQALSNFNLSIKNGEIISLIGESGSGKSTLLKILAGTERQDSGNLYSESKCINEISADKRDFRMIWQNLLLFPHMNVYRNIEFGLEMQKISPASREEKIKSICKSLKIEDKVNKVPSQLSGGEKQRVAIARALVLNPKVLLMDEPFSSLDTQTSAHLQKEILRIKKEFGLTILLVTHTVSDALLVSDRMVVLKNGTIQQVGTPKEVFSEPRNRYVAEFVSKMNALEGEVSGRRKEKIFFKTDVGTIASKEKKQNVKKGRKGVLLLRPDSIKASREEPSNKFQRVSAKFSHESLVGSIVYQYFLLKNGQKILVEGHVSGNIESFESNEKVYLSWREGSSKIIYHLNVLCWTGYDEKDILSPFEQQNGVRVDAEVFYNADQMLDMIENGHKNYDVAIVDLEYVKHLKKNALIKPFNVESLSHYHVLSPFRDFFNPSLKENYAVPLRYGSNAIAYNTRYFDSNEVQSYDILWSDKANGKIGIWDWYLPTMGSIGSTIDKNDPYGLKDKGLRKLKKLLISLRRKGVKFYETPAEIQEAFKSEEIIISPGTGLHLSAGDLQMKGYPIKESIPRSGGIRWTETATIPSKSVNTDVARKFVEYLLSSKAQSKLALRDAYYSGIVNSDALRHLSKKQRKTLKMESANDILLYLNKLVPRRIPSKVKKWKQIWNHFRGR